MILDLKIKLKRITVEDLPMLYEWRNQTSIRKVMINSDLISWKEHVTWYNKYKENENSRTMIFYYENIPYGVLNVQGIDYSNQRCEWGFYVGDLSAPRGIGTILGYASLNYIFEEIGMRKVSAEVLDYNDKSLGLHKKLGFIKEGLLREHIIKNEKSIDVILYGIFKEEWQKRRKTIVESIEGRLL